MAGHWIPGFYICRSSGRGICFRRNILQFFIFEIAHVVPLVLLIMDISDNHTSLYCQCAVFSSLLIAETDLRISSAQIPQTDLLSVVQGQCMI